MVAGKNIRTWSRVLEDAIENYPVYNAALEKETKLFQNLAERGELGKNVTVLCCGDGRELGMLLDLHRKFPQIRQLNGVDLLEISIDQVRDKIRDKVGGVEVNLLCEDASKTSIAKGSQDTVTCMLTMVNFDDRLISKLFGHVRGILKPGGKFVFSVYSRDAFDTRMELYARANLLVADVDRETGLVIFEKGFEEATFSREFDKSQIEGIVGEHGLEFSHFDSIGITHLVVMQKPKEYYRRVVAWPFRIGCRRFYPFNKM